MTLSGLSPRHMDKSIRVVSLCLKRMFLSNATNIQDTRVTKARGSPAINDLGWLFLTLGSFMNATAL